MKILKTIKSNLLDLMDFTDKVVDKIDINKGKVNTLLEEIVEEDKAGEDVKEKVITYRALLAYSMLLNNDLRKGLNQLSVYYKLAKIGDIDLGLKEDDTKRLEYLLSEDKNNFGITKGKITPKDADLFKKIVNRVAENTEFSNEEFVKSLRESSQNGGEKE